MLVQAVLVVAAPLRLLEQVLRVVVVVVARVAMKWFFRQVI